METRHDSAVLLKQTTLDVPESRTKGSPRVSPSPRSTLQTEFKTRDNSDISQGWTRLKALASGKHKLSNLASKECSSYSTRRPTVGGTTRRPTVGGTTRTATLDMDYTTDDSFKIGDKHLESVITEDTEMTMTSYEESRGEIVSARPISSYHRRLKDYQEYHRRLAVSTLYTHETNSVDDYETMSNYHNPEGNFAFFKYGDGMVKLINIRCRLASVMDLVRKYLGVDQKVAIDLTTMGGEFLHLPTRDPTTDMRELLLPRETYIAYILPKTQSISETSNNKNPQQHRSGSHLTVSRHEKNL